MKTKYLISYLLLFLWIITSFIQSKPVDLSGFEVPPLKYIFSLDTAGNGGYGGARVSDIGRKYYYPDMEVKEVKYFADGILIKTIKREEARKDGNGRSFDFRFANPDKRTKLQPVKHKFEIDSTHGLFVEERTLYVYLNNVNDKKDTFIEGIEDETKVEKDFPLHGRFRARLAPGKQPPYVRISGGSVGKYTTTELEGIDNGEITKIEYFVDGKLIFTHHGGLPYGFEVVNPEKKTIGTELMLWFKVYDDDGNITEAPSMAYVEKDTSIEFHDEDFLFTGKSSRNYNINK